MRNGLLRLLCTLLVLVLLVPLSACSASEAFFSPLLEQLQQLIQRQPGARQLSAHQLVQKIADTLRNSSDVTKTYESIPEAQKDQLTLDQFQQYLTLLRKGIPGSIVSFSLMTGHELEEVQESIRQQLPDQADLIESLVGFWIHYRGVGQSEKRFALYVHQQEGQAATLSGAWIQQIIDLHQFSLLYFDALNRADQEALTFLLGEQAYSPDILAIRAARLIAFYRDNINSQTDEFLLTHARIDSIGFEAFGITNPDGSQSVSRTMTMVQAGPDRYQVIDVLPETVHSEDLIVLYDSKQLFVFGQEDEANDQVRSGDLESIIGTPLLHDDRVCQTLASGIQKMELTYGPLRLKAEGTCFRHSRWSGRVTEIELIETACSIGSGLHPNVSVERLLTLYPFAREAGYTISGQSDQGRVQIRFVVDGDRVKQIILAYA